MKEAKLWRKVGEGIVCQLCWRYCRISDIGYCRVRVVKDGRLYTLTYGNLSAIESRPMEIKPFFHFKPGSTALTFSTYSCNLDCPWCQNWHISKVDPPKAFRYVSPKELVEKAKLFGDIGLCASFNEPTLLFEYLLDAFELAKSMSNTIVSNGFMTPKALEMLWKSGLDGINIDVKGNDEVYERYCGGKAKFVWKTARKAVKLGLHLEIVCLIVTDVNDGEDTIEEIVENHLRYVGAEIPIHFTRYYPAYVFRKPPTPIERLERAIEIADKMGVEYVYIGNVPGHRRESTFCPNCGELLIKRYSYEILENRIKDGRCPKCGYEIYGVW